MIRLFCKHKYDILINEVIRSEHMPTESILLRHVLVQHCPKCGKVKTSTSNL